MQSDTRMPGHRRGPKAQPVRPAWLRPYKRNASKLASRLASLSVAPALIIAISVLAIGLIFAAELFDNHHTSIHIAAGIGLLAVCMLCLGMTPYLQQAMRMQNRHKDAMRRLLHEKNVAEAANAAKSRYLANISHEIRSPLNAIYGYAQLVERDGSVSPREAAKVIRRSAEHLTSLVEGLLDISQVESGVLHINSDIVRFGAFIDQIARMLRPGAESKGLEFRLVVPELLPEFVRMDQSRLRQVLINLLSNAIKFTAQGSVTLAVSYAGQMAVFEVRDTGPGIAPEDQLRIFNPFERGTGAGEENQPGVGLGLPISDALVQILGGKLELESQPGAGSCFRVTMMLGHVAGHRQQRAAACKIIGYEGNRRSVLVVDDDVGQLGFVRSLLESIGFVITAVPSGEKAIALGAMGGFDLAILDISMPEINGWDVARNLRSRLGHSIRIIMLSANAQELHQSETSDPVHDLFLVKPVQFETLVDAIGRELALHWIRDANPEAGKTASPEPDSGPAQPQEAIPRYVLPEAAQPHVTRLRELLRIGHVRGIEAEIRKIAEVAPQADGLVAVLFDDLDRFDLSAMAKRLESI
jgi:signal transduction histidine kinase/CheY-like chemotaxis protein